MRNFTNNIKSTPYHNKLKHKLIVLISTIKYVNSKYQKYTQKIILYYFNANLKRNGQTISKLKTMQNYLYKLEKDIKVTTNYHKHLGVNCGTEIYYQLNFSKKDCYQKINQYFQEKKLSRFKSRVKNHLKDKFNKNGNVYFKECLNNNNNNIKEERKINQITLYQIKNYYNKCNFKSKKTLSILNLNLNKDTMFKVFKIIKKIEFDLIKGLKMHLNKSYLKEKQNKLKEILNNTQKQLEKNGYNSEQLKINFQKIYENYKLKPHFIIENHKYTDLSYIKCKLEKSIERKKENSQKNYENLKTNIFNILIEQLKKETNIEILKPIIKEYLNNKKKIEYNKVFGTYYLELLEIIKKQKNSLTTEEFNIKSG
ncbi:plasmid maintenance protein [Borreliella burgdorferi]|uniref:plasmid maintenance protein n=4 Tax=Borreliella burgdorferi TaxID=139 RepID=UPI001E461F1D|nr:plasmid maintenance protein [Borreliella burgdorferi]MCD2309289.1 plasmid maintenance protein [Borreliella burgdorferi]